MPNVNEMKCMHLNNMVSRFRIFHYYNNEIRNDVKKMFISTLMYTAIILNTVFI